MEQGGDNGGNGGRELTLYKGGALARVGDQTVADMVYVEQGQDGVWVQVDPEAAGQNAVAYQPVALDGEQLFVQAIFQGGVSDPRWKASVNLTILGDAHGRVTEGANPALIDQIYAYILECIRTQGVEKSGAAIQYALHVLGGSVAMAAAAGQGQHAQRAQFAPSAARQFLARAGLSLSEADLAALSSGRLAQLSTQVREAIERGKAALTAELERQFLTGKEVPPDVAFARRYLPQLQTIRGVAERLHYTQSEMPLGGQIAALVASVRDGRTVIPSSITGSWGILASYNSMRALGGAADPHDFGFEQKRGHREGARAALIGVLSDIIPELQRVRDEYVQARVQSM